MRPAEPVDSKAEIKRLKAKLGAIPDRDIKAALQARIAELEAKVAAEEAQVVKEEEEKEPEAPPPPPTPEQAERAERLIRQAMLEKQRGNKAAVTKLLQEAVEVAPGAPATLEAQGDDFAERRHVKEAIECYKRAMALDPKNVGLEKKHAMLVFNVGMAGSLEDQMRANLSDSPFLSGSDHVASYGAAKILTYFFPGLGHLVLGKTVAGFGFLAASLTCWIWLGILVVKANRNGKLILSASLLPPVVIGVIVILVAVASLGGGRAAARTKAKPSHPKPPVDLPFD